MGAGAAKPTNEELIERLRAAGEGTPGAAAIMGELWGQNIRLVRLTVHRLTGLNVGEQGFEDMEQQAYFSFHAAAFTYDPAGKWKFSTYGAKRIGWELCRYYECGGFTIRISTYMKQRFRDCAKKKRELERETGRAVTYEEALNAMGLHPAAVAGTLAALRKQETASLGEQVFIAVVHHGPQPGKLADGEGLISKAANVQRGRRGQLRKVLAEKLVHAAAPFIVRRVARVLMVQSETGQPRICPVSKM